MVYICTMRAEEDVSRSEAIPVIGIMRHRLSTDGEGVTTLVAFHGCPLECRYCLNPQCKDKSDRWRRYTGEALYEEVKVDENGEPIIGATIREKGTRNGTSTDINGLFSLKISGGKPIEISYVGYETRTISEKKAIKKNLKIVLKITEQVLGMTIIEEAR